MRVVYFSGSLVYMKIPGPLSPSTHLLRGGWMKAMIPSQSEMYQGSWYRLVGPVLDKCWCEEIHMEMFKGMWTNTTTDWTRVGHLDDFKSMGKSE